NLAARVLSDDLTSDLTSTPRHASSRPRPRPGLGPDFDLAATLTSTSTSTQPRPRPGLRHHLQPQPRLQLTVPGFGITASPTPGKVLRLVAAPELQIAAQCSVLMQAAAASMAPTSTSHAWTEEEEQSLLSWLEAHPQAASLTRRTLSDVLKKEVFPDSPELDHIKINYKIGNMKKAYKATLRISQQPEFIARFGNDEVKKAEALERKCRSFHRLHRVYRGGFGDSPDDQISPLSIASQDPDQGSQPTLSVSALGLATPTTAAAAAGAGDDFAGLRPLLPLPPRHINAVEAVRDTDTASGNEASEPGPDPRMLSTDATPITHLATPQPPQQPQQQQLQQQQQQQQQQQIGSALGSAASGRKRKRAEPNFLLDHDETLAAMEKSINDAKDAAVQIAKVQYEAALRVAEIERQKHLMLARALLRVARAQDAHQLQQKQQEDSIFAKVMERLAGDGQHRDS
ncbi:hypothetical protein KEM52_004208, partial [Ascosphaera acerosa]